MPGKRKKKEVSYDNVKAAIVGWNRDGKLQVITVKIPGSDIKEYMDAHGCPSETEAIDELVMEEAIELDNGRGLIILDEDDVQDLSSQIGSTLIGL